MEKTERGMKILCHMLGYILIAVFLFFIIAQMVFPSGNEWEDNTYQVFQAEWVQEMPDGTKVPVEIPGNCDVEYGEWGRISTKLPKNQQKSNLMI